MAKRIWNALLSWVRGLEILDDLQGDMMQDLDRRLRAVEAEVEALRALQK